MTLYATGVCHAELCRLKVTDVDSERMVLHVQQGNRAIVAVARKLAVLLHRIWVTREPYIPF